MPTPQEERNTLFVEQASCLLRENGTLGVSNSDRQTQPVKSTLQSKI
ncbi:MAG: hypothetical protein LH628_01350 [Microcoleus sp. CAN_BIN18]|nr:hypothetical protein [Microcoleus sp. CAN_BIN18]